MLALRLSLRRRRPSCHSTFSSSSRSGLDGIREGICRCCRQLVKWLKSYKSHRDGRADAKLFWASGFVRRRRGEESEFWLVDAAERSLI